MLNVVKSLLFRLKKSKLFWILLGVCAVLPLLTLGLYQLVIEIAGSLADVPIDMGMGMVTYMSLSALALPSNDVNFLALLCVSIFLCKEYNDGTIRNALLSNKSRVALYSAYGVVALIIGGSFLVTNFVSNLLALGVPFGFGDATPNEAITSCACSFMLGILSLIFVVSCVLMFLFATGRQAPALLLPILVTLFLPSVLSSIVDIVTTLLAIIQMGSDATIDFTMEYYSWIPLYNATLYDASNVDGALVGKISLYYVPISALFAYLGGLAAVKKDLK